MALKILEAELWESWRAKGNQASAFKGPVRCITQSRAPAWEQQLEEHLAYT